LEIFLITGNKVHL